MRRCRQITTLWLPSQREHHPKATFKLDDNGGASNLGPIFQEASPMRKLIVLSIAAALVLSACNTVAGVGRDAQSAGKAVTKAARN